MADRDDEEELREGEHMDAKEPSMADRDDEEELREGEHMDANKRLEKLVASANMSDILAKNPVKVDECKVIIDHGSIHALEVATRGFCLLFVPTIGWSLTFSSKLSSSNEERIAIGRFVKARNRYLKAKRIADKKQDRFYKAMRKAELAISKRMKAEVKEQEEKK